MGCGPSVAQHPPFVVMGPAQGRLNAATTKGLVSDSNVKQQAGVRASAFPRRDFARVFVRTSSLENRGRRESRVPTAPAASHANEKSIRA